jgi:uncharacterized protein YbjT (DUF2867 family)
MQGRSVACTLLQSGRYRVRALTRRVDAPEAQNLARRSAELMTLLLEVGHKGELVNAFRGSQGVFLMTPPIAPPKTHEMELGKQQADAAVEAGVQHITFSALGNVVKITDGKKWAPHFTDKARIEEYIRRLPVASSFVHLAFFYTNLIDYYSPRMDGDTLVFPIIIHVPVWAAGDRPVAFAGIPANRGFFLAHYRAPSDGNPIRGCLGCSARPPAAEAQCI